MPKITINNAVQLYNQRGSVAKEKKAGKVAQAAHVAAETLKRKAAAAATAEDSADKDGDEDKRPSPKKAKRAPLSTAKTIAAKGRAS